MAIHGNSEAPLDRANVEKEKRKICKQRRRNKMVDIQGNGAYEFQRKWFDVELLAPAKAFRVYFHWLERGSARLAVSFYQGSTTFSLHLVDGCVGSCDICESDLASAISFEKWDEVSQWLNEVSEPWKRAEALHQLKS